MRRRAIILAFAASLSAVACDEKAIEKRSSTVTVVRNGNQISAVATLNGVTQRFEGPNAEADANAFVAGAPSTNAHAEALRKQAEELREQAEVLERRADALEGS